MHFRVRIEPKALKLWFQIVFYTCMTVVFVFNTVFIDDAVVKNEKKKFQQCCSCLNKLTLKPLSMVLHC